LDYLITKYYDGTDWFIEYEGPYGKSVMNDYVYKETTAIEDVDADKSLCVYPNPFTASTTIKPTADLQHANLQLYNAAGQIVRQIDNLSGSSISLERGDLPNGIYNIQLKQGNATIGSTRVVAE
jgi:hypothetical protein